jgi:branched-chain amino acid transport system substrate-binding protein
VKQRLLALLVSSLAFVCVARAEESVVRQKIGVILPLTGLMSVTGQTLLNALQLADGDKDPADEFEFIVEDDGFSPKNAVSAVTKLITQDKVAGLIVFGSGSALAVADIVEKEKVPMIAIAFSDKLTAGRKFVFRLNLFAQDVAERLCAEARRRNYHKIAIVASSVEAMSAVKTLFTAGCPINIAVNEEVLPGEAELKTLAARVRQAEPQGVLLLCIPPQISILSRALRDIGYKGDFFSTVVGAYRQEIRASHGALIGAWLVLGDDTAAGDFYRRYRERFGEPEVVEGPFMYDAAAIMLAALRQEGTATIANLKAFSGLLGKYTVESSHSFRVPLVVRRVTEQWFEPVE